MMSEKKINLSIGIVSIILSCAIYFLVPFEVNSDPIPGTGDLVRITPAAIPLICAVAFVVIGGLFILQPYVFAKSDDQDDDVTFSQDGLVRGCVTLLIVISYPALLEALGFLLGTTVILFALNLYFGTRKIWQLVLGAVILPICLTYIFGSLMYVPLPNGYLFG